MGLLVHGVVTTNAEIVQIEPRLLLYIRPHVGKPSAVVIPRTSAARAACFVLLHEASLRETLSRHVVVVHAQGELFQVVAALQLSRSLTCRLYCRKK